MAIESYFFNALLNNGVYDRTYTAEDFTNYLNLLVSNGVFANPSNQLQVQASTGMNVVVRSGSGWINGHKMNNTADLILPIDASDVLLNRIDRVVFYLDLSSRDMGIKLLKGVGAATNPVAPALTRNDLRYEMSLALVNVGKQITSITDAMITDTRFDESVCGIVKGLIEEIETSDLFRQYNTAFYDWFMDVKETLSTSTLLRKYEATHTTINAHESTFDVKDYIPNYSFNLDILEVYINDMRLNEKEYTKYDSSVVLTHSIDTVGTAVSFVVYKSVDGSDAGTVVDIVDELSNAVIAMQEQLRSKQLKKSVITLPVNSWVASGTVWTQTVAVSHITSVDEVIMVSPVENVPVRATNQAVGSLTFTAYEKPTGAVTVNVVNMGV